MIGSEALDHSWLVIHGLLLQCRRPLPAPFLDFLVWMVAALIFTANRAEGKQQLLWLPHPFGVREIARAFFVLGVQLPMRLKLPLPYTPTQSLFLTNWVLWKQEKRPRRSIR